MPYFEAKKAGGSVAFSYKTWLASAGISASGYPDLSDVLADEAALRKLMTIHAAVDYLAGWDSADAGVVAVLNSDLAAKWITLRDYAEDTLTAAYGSLMASIGKYGYGEWALMPQVPKMTGIQAPYGEVVYDGTTYSTGYEAFRVFDGDSTKYWASGKTGSINVGAWVGYHFPYAICVKRFAIKITNVGNYTRIPMKFRIDASNDGTNWTPVSSEITINTLDLTYYNISNDTDYTYYRLYIIDQTHTSTQCGEIDVLQFYAWQAKGNVPIMTGDNTPYGEASGSSYYSPDTLSYYKAFDGNIGDYDCWGCNVTGASSTGWLQYKFTNPVNVKRFLIAPRTGQYMDSFPVNLTLKASNDGFVNDTHTLGTFTTQKPSTASVFNQIFEVSNNDSYYLYYRLECANIYNTDRISIGTLQFYGRELKVSVPIMTNNTAPYGNIDASNEITPAYNAFNGEITHVVNDLNWWSGGTGSNPWIQYEFTNKVKVKKIYLVALYNNDNIECKDFKIQGSNDGFVNDVHEIYQGQLQNDTSEPLISFDIVDDEYLYYRLTILSTYSTGRWKALRYLQFYGEDYTERDWDQDNPRHYLYDHGVEPDGTLTLSGSATKGNYSLKLAAQNAQASKSFDVSSYNLMRGHVGQNASGTNQLICGSGSANFVADYMPYNQSLDISSLNGSQTTGVKQTAAGTFECEEIWVE